MGGGRLHGATEPHSAIAAPPVRLLAYAHLVEGGMEEVVEVALLEPLVRRERTDPFPQLLGGDSLAGRDFPEKVDNALTHHDLFATYCLLASI